MLDFFLEINLSKIDQEIDNVLKFVYRAFLAKSMSKIIVKVCMKID